MFKCHEPPAAACVLCGCTPRRPCCRTCGPSTPHLCATCVFTADPLDLVEYFFGPDAFAEVIEFQVARIASHTQAPIVDSHGEPI